MRNLSGDYICPFCVSRHRRRGRVALAAAAPLDVEPKVSLLENRAVLALLLLLAIGGFVLTGRLLWQFRDAFTPVGVVAAGFAYGYRLFTPRRQP